MLWPIFKCILLIIIVHLNFAINSFLMNIVYRLNVSDGGNRIGLIRFSTNSYIDFFLDTYSTADEMSEFILNMPYEGGTCKV